MDVASFTALLAQQVRIPEDGMTNWLMVLRWVHFVAGITWIGLLYFFNLINVPFMKEIDAGTKGKVVPTLLARALWWFRWGAVVTVLAGLWYWMHIMVTDARNARIILEIEPRSGLAVGSFFLIWIAAFAIFYAVLIPMKVNRGPVLAVIVFLLVTAASALYLVVNSGGWESNRMLAIGIGGGMGLFMMLNVWGIIWRHQKKIIRWTAANAADGTAIPAESATLARQAFLASRTNFWVSFPMLFFMAAASHYPMFGGPASSLP